MSRITSMKVAVTTDGSGVASVVSDMPALGRILQMRYTPDGTNPLATGADLTVTLNESGVNVVTKADIGTSAFTLAPRQPVQNSTDGSAALYAAGGTAQVDFVYSGGERLKVAIAQGGSAKSGVFEFLIG